MRHLLHNMCQLSKVLERVTVPALEPPAPPLVNGTGNSPSPGRPTPGVVKQDKSSGGSVDTTKTRSDPQRVRMSGGERPIGAAKGKQSDTEALCQPPAPRGPQAEAWLRAGAREGGGTFPAPLE